MTLRDALDILRAEVLQWSADRPPGWTWKDTDPRDAYDYAEDKLLTKHIPEGVKVID